MMKSYRFLVAGRVQGVGFRAATQHKALALGLHGWVRNREDGAVEGLVGGEEEARLREFREWLAHGPPAAHVDRVEWNATAPEAHEFFAVRR
jgi:acylphosphatase